MAAFEASQGEKISALQFSFERLSDAITDQIDLVRDAVADAGRALSLVTNAISSRIPEETAVLTQLRTNGAVDALRRSVGRGVLPETEVLGKLLENIGNTPEAFATREDYLKDFYRTNAVLKDAEALAQNSLTIEEQILAALEQRLTDAAAQNAAMILRLQAQIELLASLPASLAGVMPTGAALGTNNALFTAEDMAQFTQAAAAIAQIYGTVLGRAPDLLGLNYYLDLLSSGSQTLASITSLIAGSAEATTGVIPTNTGGTTSGGGTTTGGTTSGGGTTTGGTTTTDTAAAQAAAQAAAAAAAAAAIAQANGTAALGSRPRDPIGDLYGNNGVPISLSGYNFWASIYQQHGLAFATSNFLQGAANEGTLGSVPAYASGTNFHPGGLAMVGEAGAELVNMPRGSSVSTAGQTRSMFDQSGLVAELRELREEVARMRAENNNANRRIEGEVARGSWCCANLT